jgi:membrane-bound serine protease (ClpP class)
MNSLHRSFISIFLAAFVVCSIVPAIQAQQVVRIRIDSTINPITQEYIERGIDHAEQIHASAVLIELSTPGGLVDSTRGIIQKMLASKAPVIVFVTPTGSRAASAGFFILEAADIAAMSPGTNTGAAHPVILGEKMDDAMKSKMENDSAAFMRSFVSKRGRNVELAESAVRESKSWTDQEALDKHLIDVIAKDPADLWKQLDGRTFSRFNGEKQTLHFSNVSEEDYKVTLREGILGWLMDPNIAFLVFALGALALYAEFNHPGAVIPGVVGLIAILLAVFALNLLPTRYAALVLILAAFVLFALEAKFMTHGVLGIGGVIALTLGGLLLVDGPIPEMRVKIWTALGVSVPLGLITVVLMSLAIKAHRNKVVTGQQGLIGEIGVAQTALAPEGKVFVHGELWDAVSSEPIVLGASVVVSRVDGLKLEVAPAPKPQAVSAN